MDSLNCVSVHLHVIVFDWWMSLDKCDVLRGCRCLWTLGQRTGRLKQWRCWNNMALVWRFSLLSKVQSESEEKQIRCKISHPIVDYPGHLLLMTISVSKHISVSCISPSFKSIFFTSDELKRSFPLNFKPVAVLSCRNAPEFGLQGFFWLQWRKQTADCLLDERREVCGRTGRTH